MQPIPADQLHHVVGDAVLLADTEHRDDVGVVQLRGSLCFADEPLAPRIVELRVRGEHLERDRPAERFLHRLEHHSHPTAAEFADDAEIAEAVGKLFLLRDTGGAAEPLQVFHLRDGGEQFAELVGVVRVLRPRNR